MVQCSCHAHDSACREEPPAPPQTSRCVSGSVDFCSGQTCQRSDFASFMQRDANTFISSNEHGFILQVGCPLCCSNCTGLDTAP